MRLNLAVDLESREGYLDRDPVLKNAVIEHEGDATAAVKRPGLDTPSNIGAGTGQMLAAFNQALKTVVGDSFKEVNDAGSVTATTALSPIFTGLDFTAQQSATSGSGAMMFKTANEAWVYRP